MTNFRDLLHEIVQVVDIHLTDDRVLLQEEELLALELDLESEEQEAELGDWLDGCEAGPGDWANEEGPYFERIAWYAPIHFYGDEAGIFITEKGVRFCASFYRDACRNAGVPVTNLQSVLGGIDLLLRHEVFHHEVESFAIRQHIVTGTNFYVDYRRGLENAHGSTISDDNLEEGLASAREHQLQPSMLWSGAKRTKEEVVALRKHLELDYTSRPPGYRTAIQYIQKGNFQLQTNGLMYRMIRNEKSHSTEAIAMYGFTFETGMFNRELIKNWALVRSPKVEPMPFTFSIPTRLIEKALDLADYEKVPGGGKGSHSKWRNRKTGRFVTVPHRKDQEGYKALKVVARELGFNSLRELSNAI